MSRQRQVLEEIATAICTGGEFRIAAWFTEDFRFYDPARPDWPRGHAGATALLDSFRALSPPITYEIVDAIEDGDRIAVRWMLTAIYQNAPLQLASLAIYRFEAGRIAEDWGLKARGTWT